MAEAPKKDWSHINELYRKAKEKARSEMSPEQLQQVLTEDKIGRKMRREVEIKAKDAQKKDEAVPEQIEEAKANLDKIYEEVQPEKSQGKSIADMIAEAEEKNKQFLGEALEQNKKEMEKLNKMPLDERMDYVQRKREETRESRMSKLLKRLGGNKNE